MTTSRYILARIAQAFGIVRRQRRMAEAASEMHLLREAEQFLGQKVWDKVENIEELGIEYWNLRRLLSERDKLSQQLDESEEVLALAHDQRTNLLGAKTEPQLELEEKRSELLTRLEKLARERDELITRAREIRRIYDGMRTKLDVLGSEANVEEKIRARTKDRMTELRTDFTNLKERRDALATEIGGIEVDLGKVEEQIDEERSRHRKEAAAAFQQIGDANRNISALKAEMGLIETQMLQLYGEIGRHVSRNVASNPGCSSASKDYRPMVEVMSQLRRSISLNHRLAGM